MLLAVIYTNRGACVVGVPDAKVGERIKAMVVLKEDAGEWAGPNSANGAENGWRPKKSPPTSNSGTCCSSPWRANS